MDRPPNIRQENNFDLLRLLFALTILVVHGHALSREPDLFGIATFLNGKFALDGFFVISGFLVTMSYEHSKSLADYVGRRASRLLPAYCFIVVSCFLAWMAVSGFAPSWGDLLIGSKYLLFNLAFLNFLQPTLPGLFEGNPISAVNGALWTVKVEVMFYAAVPVMVWLVHKFGRAVVLAGLYVLGLVYFNALSHLASAAERPLFHELARQMPGQLPFFVAGMALYYYHSWFSERIRFLLPLAVLGLMTPSFLSLTPIYPASLAILVVTAALHLPRIVNLTAVGDLSFGIYGLHFPILQALVAAGAFAGDGFALLSAGAALAILSAWFSWRVIERPFLRGSRHFRGAQARRRMPVTPSAVGASHSPG